MTTMLLLNVLFIVWCTCSAYAVLRIVRVCRNVTSQMPTVSAWVHASCVILILCIATSPLTPLIAIYAVAEWAKDREQARRLESEINNNSAQH